MGRHHFMVDDITEELWLRIIVQQVSDYMAAVVKQDKEVMRNELLDLADVVDSICEAAIEREWEHWGDEYTVRKIKKGEQ